MVFAAVLLALQVFSTPATAETRRAFLVGIKSYSDPYIPQLRLSVNDAKDMAKDLEEVGFDKKNIKVATDLRNRDAFEKEFSAFLNTVEKGDTVIFFFSGHGFGVEADQTNYLLFGDLKSPFSFTQKQMNDRDSKNAAVVRLRIPQYLDQYQRDEIPYGISTVVIQRRLAEKNPGAVIMIVDACRTILRGIDQSDTPEVKLAARGKESGSRLINVQKPPPPGFLILYSASFGEQAIEGLSGPLGGDRNSLFTGVLRSEMLRPGQSIVDLGARVSRVVRGIADKSGINQQEPEVVYDKTSPAAEKVENFRLIGSIGRERFQIVEDRCEGAVDDWEQIKGKRKRELYVRHRQRFDHCPGGTADFARQAIALMGLGSDEPAVTVGVPVNRTISECDRLAASEYDFRRPPEVPGVDRIEDPDVAIAACTKAIEENPRIPRYLFNLGRAYHQRSLLQTEKTPRERDVASARLRYDDAAARGYESALNNLAVIEDFEGNNEKAVELFKRAAQAQHPLAMYNLGIRYRDGTGVQRDRDHQAKEWLAQAAEKNFVPAMVAYGNLLASKPDRRGLEWLERAANLGSQNAKYWLGYFFYNGRAGMRDPDQALLWFGRVAQTNDMAEAYLAMMMENGEGLPGKEPDSAASYWRLAAQRGNAFAEVEFADKLRQGFHLHKEEYGEGEIIDFLERAADQGSVRAAVALAQIYRNGESGVQKKPKLAMQLAYRAIDLAVQAEQTDLDDNPFYEMNAAHMLVEMAKSGEAVNSPLTQDEIDRIERYYGKVNEGASRVNIRRLSVTINCGLRDPKTQKYLPGFYWTLPPQSIWVWDWGRTESPTEMQFRNIERKNRFCTGNELLRSTLTDIFEQSKKSKVAFADLIYERISVLQGLADAPDRDDGNGRRHRRHRR
jgi:TPR repeat protein